MKLSIVAPVYNESENLRQFADKVKHVLSSMEYEIIFVDDGSTDDSLSILNSLEFDRKTVISLAFNSGHMAALDAGFRRANGDFVVSMDSDLQHPPELITQLIDEATRSGADVVYAVRENRNGDSFLKKATAALYYFILRQITGIPVRKSAADFRLLSKRALTAINSYPPGHSIFRLLIPSLRMNESQVLFTASDRYAGKSKYTVSKMVTLGLNSILTATVRPLHYSIGFGAIVSSLSLVSIAWVVFDWSLGGTVSGWASTISILLFLFGALFINMGVIGLYLGKLFTRSSGAPSYVVDSQNSSSWLES